MATFAGAATFVAVAVTSGVTVAGRELDTEDFHRAVEIAERQTVALDRRLNTATVAQLHGEDSLGAVCVVVAAGWVAGVDPAARLLSGLTCAAVAAVVVVLQVDRQVSKFDCEWSALGRDGVAFVADDQDSVEWG